jgi:amino acid transporter
VSFALYVIGTLIAIGGVAWALITAGVRPLYVIITCVILLGVGIVSAVTRTRSKDAPKGPST